jgi:formylglycine-generating enzyme required for sulfatase activity/serine/threonine protein kinase
MEQRAQTGGILETLFADWLARGGVEAELEELCRAHGEHAAALRELAQVWQGFAPLLQRAGIGVAEGGRSFTQRLRERYGPDVDPVITLEPEKAAQPPTSELLLRLSGRVAGGPRYAVRGELARGGMGAILRVYDEDLRRPLAMKVILGDEEGRADAAGIDRRRLARFLEEAQVTGQLDHPGIVPVHELGLDEEGRVFFTMKLVKGRDLKAVFELVFAGKEGWNETRALGVLLKVCEALAYAHSKGVIHRDLKPANAMVGGFGEVYVMDWGLARVVGRPDSHDLRVAPEVGTVSSVKTERRAERAEAPDSPLFTMDGDVVGTPAYMPPEQAKGQVERLSARSDVYAIGAMLYHLLARQMPYVPPDARVTNRTVLGMVVQGPPEPLARLRPSVPAELVAIVERAMAREPDERYRDTLELADDLRAYLEGRVVRAYETGALAEARKWVERNRALAGAAAAAVLLLVAGLATSLVFKVRSDRNALLASENAAHAQANERVALARAEEVLRLSALQELDDRIAEAQLLWPAEPERIGEYEAWLARAEALVAELPSHEAKLAEFTAMAEAGDSMQSRWWHQQLQKLVDGLKAFADPETGLASSGVSPEHGWGVRKRLELAERLRAGHATDGDLARAWAEALPAIRADYDGLELVPQVGLVPLGPDPDSHLWEFAHLATGEIPARAGIGTLVLDVESALVLVLVPGDRFQMGSQAISPAAPNHDVDAVPDESPVHEVELAPFFLAKHEMTQAQWLRFTGTNPSNYAAGITGGHQTTLWHPVEDVNWTLCTETLARLGLQLPTEAQWEFAARAGTTTPWWTGAEKESLVGAANLADSAYKRGGASPGTRHEEWLDDGRTVHAPIGSYAANPFGLHDVIGNVWEWSADAHELYTVAPRAGDGARGSLGLERVPRGGAFDSNAEEGRIANRGSVPPDYSDPQLGVRPAMRIRP